MRQKTVKPITRLGMMRRALDWSADDVAKEVGVSKAQYFRFEKGEIEPPKLVSQLLLDVFKLPELTSWAFLMEPAPTFAMLWYLRTWDNEMVEGFDRNTEDALTAQAYGIPFQPPAAQSMVC